MIQYQAQPSIGHGSHEDEEAADGDEEGYLHVAKHRGAQGGNGNGDAKAKEEKESRDRVENHDEQCRH